VCHVIEAPDGCCRHHILCPRADDEAVHWRCEKIGNGEVVEGLAARQDGAKRAALIVFSGMDLCRKAGA
jgi:hypothetical protein